ncbi:MAG: serine kinase [Steroidobacteraceae bacterium]
MVTLVTSDRASADLSPDPFLELGAPPASRCVRVLGADFEFQTASRELARLVEQAYASVPEHRLSRPAPHFVVRLVEGSLAPARGSESTPRVETLSGGGLLCGATRASTFAAISPREWSALIVVSHEMLRRAYHVRYELIELTVFTLATRVQELVPLHAACLGRGGQGLLVMGDSGAGKSTAALHGALHGLELVSEDSVLVEPESMLATGVANFLHLHRDALGFLPSPIARQLRRFPVIRRRSGAVKLEIDLRRAGLPLAEHPLSIRALVFADARRARGPLLTRLPNEQVLARLEGAQPYAAHRPQWPAFANRAAMLPAFELRRGEHPREAAAELATLVAGAREKSPATP